jgi:proline iminopeptidase
MKLPTALFLLLAGCGHAHVPAPLSPGEGSAAINGSVARWHIFGHGPVVVVEPGGPGLSWDYLRMPALEEHLTVVYIEPVGSGDSGRLADAKGYTRARWVDDLDKIREHLGLDRIILLGHSYGGFIAQDYAIQHGAHLRGLILFGTSPRTDKDFGEQIQRNLKRFEGESWFKDAFAAMGEEDKATSEDEGKAIVRREVPFYVENYSAHAEEIQRRVANLRFNPAAEHGEGTPFDVREALRGVHIPTLVLSGEHDFICDPRFGREMHEAIAGSRLVIIPNANHMAHWDQPEAVARAIHSFVADVEK